MAKELIEKVVDGQTYKIAQFGSTEAIKTFTQLTKLVGPSISMAMGANDQGVDQGQVIGKAMIALCERLDENNVEQLVKKLIGQVLKGQGEKIIFETEFQGRFGHLLKLLIAVVEVQYGDFLDVVQGFDANLGATQSTSQKTASTGGFGA